MGEDVRTSPEIGAPDELVDDDSARTRRAQTRSPRPDPPRSDAGRPDSPGPDPSDRLLLARAGAGDRSAFETLYDRHVRPVYWQTRSVLHDDREAEDATQEVFVTTWCATVSRDFGAGFAPIFVP